VIAVREIITVYSENNIIRYKVHAMKMYGGWKDSSAILDLSPRWR
jgi:hypothetical protein